MLERLKVASRRSLNQIEQYPVVSFFGLLVFLFGIIILSHVLRAPAVMTEEVALEAKESAVFTPGTDTAYVTVPAKVKKESIVNIVALTPGIVSTVLTTPGRFVQSGQTLLVLTNDYQGGSAELGKQLASENARLTAELAKIDKDITALKEKQTKRDDTLSGTEEDIALAELEKDRAVRKSSLAQSALSLELSTKNDAVLKPKVFMSGVVESIRVKRGDLVTAGQVLATVVSKNGATTLEALLDPRTARLFALDTEARLTVGNDTVTLLPTYFAQSENENGLFSVLFTLSPELTKRITNGEYLRIALPLATDKSMLVPIDAISQDDTQASVLVSVEGKAVAKTVTLGTIYGSYVEIMSGLNREDSVILSRSIVSGDAVRTR